MGDILKVADLPAKWLATAEAARSAAVSASFTECAAELEAALSQQPSAAGVPDGYVLVQQRDAHALAEWGKATAKPDGRSGVVWISARRVSDLLAPAPEQRAAQAEQQGAGDEMACKNAAEMLHVLRPYLAAQDDAKAILRMLAARRPVGQEPAAWMDPDGSRVLTAKAKADASSAYRTATAGYSVPLYVAPLAQVDLSDVRRELSDALDLLDNTTADADEDANRIGLAELAITRAIESIDQQAGKGAR